MKPSSKERDVFFHPRMKIIGTMRSLFYRERFIITSTFVISRNHRIIWLNRMGKIFLTHLSENPSTKFQPSVQSNQSQKRINPFDRHPRNNSNPWCTNNTTIHGGTLFCNLSTSAITPRVHWGKGGRGRTRHRCAGNGRATLQARLKKKKKNIVRSYGYFAITAAVSVHRYHQHFNVPLEKKKLKKNGETREREREKRRKLRQENCNA